MKKGEYKLQQGVAAAVGIICKISNRSEQNESGDFGWISRTRLGN
jgi:hypothetical protein